MKIRMPAVECNYHENKHAADRLYSNDEGTVKYYAQIRLQVWQNSVCTGQRNLPLIAQ